MIKYLKSSYKLRKEHFEPLDKQNKTEKNKYAPTHLPYNEMFLRFFKQSFFLSLSHNILHMFIFDTFKLLNKHEKAFA